MTKRKNITQSLVIQGSIIAAAGIITKIIGFIYRIPMANILGNEGNGIYSVAFGIYNIALTLSSYSLPTAISKMVANRLAKNEHKNVYKILRCALFCALIAGSTVCIFLFFGANFLENLYARLGLAYPLKVLAPTTLVVAFLGVFRGFYQGHSNMIPTAVSQIVEQIINAFVSVFASFELMQIYSNSPYAAAYGAAGGTLGTLSGALVALIIFVILFIHSKPTLKKNCSLDVNPEESKTFLYKTLMLTILPIIISSTIYQLGYTIDDLMFGKMMFYKFPEKTTTALLGVFNTQYNQMINLPIAIATSLAAASMPSIVRSFSLMKVNETHKKIASVIKISMLIAIPSACGLSILSKPIISLLFPRLTDYSSLASSLLLLGSSAVIFYSFSTITTAILQATDNMRIPVRNSAISLILHIIVNYFLMKYTNLNVYALLIGDIVLPLSISILNALSIKNRIGFSFEFKKTFFYPFVASIIMSTIVNIVYNLFLSKFISHWIALMITICIGVLVYLLAVIQFGCFATSEIKSLPIGKRFLFKLQNIKFFK